MWRCPCPIHLYCILYLEAAPKVGHINYEKESDLDLELKVSGEKIKQISASWVLASHRTSGGAGGIEDYLDPKTLQHLEDLNIIDPHTNEKPFEPELLPPIQPKEIFAGINELTTGRQKSGPDYLEISKQVRKRFHFLHFSLCSVNFSGVLFCITIDFVPYYGRYWTCFNS